MRHRARRLDGMTPSATRKRQREAEVPPFSLPFLSCGRSPTGQRGSRLKKLEPFAVIGLGRFGSSLAQELIRLGCEVLGVDRNEYVADEMGPYLTHTVIADTTEEEALRSPGIRNADCAFVIGTNEQSENFESSVNAAGS